MSSLQAGGRGGDQTAGGGGGGGVLLGDKREEHEIGVMQELEDAHHALLRLNHTQRPS